MPLISKDYTLPVLLAECEVSIVRDGVENCEMTNWLRANAVTKTLLDFEAEIASNLDWGPGSCAAIIRTCYYHNAGETALEIQRLYSTFLVAYPFSRARGFIEALLRVPLPGGPWDPIAHKRLVHAIIKHHRRAKDFLSLPDVRPHLPADIDVESLPDASEAA